MPATRTRRKRAASIPPIIDGLFSIGTGWNHIQREKGLDWIRDQWAMHGHAFDSDSWGFYAFGDPEKYINGGEDGDNKKKN